MKQDYFLKKYRRFKIISIRLTGSEEIAYLGLLWNNDQNAVWELRKFYI